MNIAEFFTETLAVEDFNPLLINEFKVFPNPAKNEVNISFKLMQQLGGGSVIGPMLIGSQHPFQIVQMGAQVNDIVNAAAMAVYETL
mgnify:CR=1 FL=1